MATSPEECTWTQDEGGTWETACDNLFDLNDGTPSANNMAFCCFCGKPILEKPFSYEEESE